MSIQEDKAMKLKDGKILYDDLRNRVEYLRGNEVLDFGTIPSKNLNITPYQSTTLAGLTITKNNDNSLTITGQPESTSIYYLYADNAHNSEYRWKLPAGTYTLSGGYSGSQAAGITLYTSQSTTSVAYAYGTGGSGQPVTFTTTQEYWAIIGFCWKNSTALITEPVTFYLQLERGPQATAYVDPFITTQGSKVLNNVIYDVLVNGRDMVTDGIANILIASANDVGVAKFANDYGIGITASGQTFISAASSTLIKNPTGGYKGYKPISAEKEHEATFYGLAIAASDTTQSSSDNAVGTYTDNAKQKIQNMLGVTDLISTEESSTATAAHTINSTFMMDGKLHRATAAIAIGDAVVVGTNCEVVKADEVFVKRTDIASTSNAGVVKIDPNFGISMRSSPNQDTIMTAPAGEQNVKEGVQGYQPIVPSRQHISVYYGLSKLAGVDLKNETVTVGTYPETSKIAIRSMLGAIGDVQANGTSVVTSGVANIPMASSSVYGVVKVSGRGLNINVNDNGLIGIEPAQEPNIKAENLSFNPITPTTQHIATFYGLARAAGDRTQKSSENAVGTYTAEAKSAIHTMLGIDPASIAAQVDIPLVETVSGTTPTITGQPNVRYVCGEVSTISITPPVNGSVDVIFESGSTATTMTVPSTIKWPAWFDAEALEANTTYEVLITDGIYGSVMTWVT